MANLTKTQVKSKVQKLYDKIMDIEAKLEDLQSDVEFERDEIEPYENKDDLTEQQEERQEWLDNAATITYVEETFMVELNAYRLDIHFTSNKMLSFYTPEFDEIKKWRKRIKDNWEKK